MAFEFATAGRVVFGAGTLDEAGRFAAGCGRHGLIVTGRDPTRAAGLSNRLEEHAVAFTIFPIRGEPTTHAVIEGVDVARRAGCDLVIGFGGGSALDAAKAIAALLTNPGDLLDYLEVVGRGRPLTQPSAPCVAIPTTAGTGAEVTRNAVLASPEHRVKASLRSPLMLPRLAIVDPDLTHALPPGLTATTGLDALTQLIEPLVCNRANPLVDALCREGLRRVARSLRRAYTHGADAGAREDMALASLFGGLALANAGLGAVHGFAAPIGGMFPAPHGAVCAALLPVVTAANLEALRELEPTHPALERYAEVARVLTGDAAARAEDAVAWLQDLGRALGVRGLATWGVTRDAIPEVVEKAAKASSMKANPVQLSPAGLSAILERAL